MDPQTTSPAPEFLAATLHNATIDKAERSDFNNATRNHPLQGAGTPALQRSLTPDSDYISVPATISLTLPRELVERILLLLDTKSTLKCRLVNRHFNGIIQSSTLVQYHLACNVAGVIDNPQSPLSYAERLAALKKREDAWRKLKPVFEMPIKVNDQWSTSHELTAGNYFLTHGDENGTDLYYCHLPSSLQDNPQWKRTSDHGPGRSLAGFIVEMGMAVYEHDLVVKVISSEVGNQADMHPYSIDLVLLKCSTGEYHPLARHPLIHVQRSPLAQPHSAVKIVGDNLALVVQYDGDSQLFIFDWKTGHKRIQHKAAENAYEYSIPVFISPKLLLVPNRSQFEVWDLFPNPNPPVQILTLQLPAVSVNYSIISIRCHGEPSPFLDSMPYFPPRPFFPSSENSIIVVNLLLFSFPGTTNPQSAYKLIMHRRTLLDMIQKWTSPSLLEQQEGLPTWLTNEVTVHKFADPDDGSVKLGAQSKLVSTISHPGSSPRTRDSPTLAASQISPISSTSHVSADSSSSSMSSGSSALSTSRYNIFQVQWADWGPPISRWFPENGIYGIQTWFTRQSTGQRCVFLDRNPRDKRKCVVGVADFNLHNVKKNAETMMQLRGGKGEDNGGNGNNREGETEENEEALEILDHKGVFSQEVYMGLKCVIYHAPGEYDFDVVMMDEERVLGLKLDGGDSLRVESIKVLYIG